MKIAFFDSHLYEIEVFKKYISSPSHQIEFFEPRLTLLTANMANGFDVVCSFVNDRIDEDTISVLKKIGVKLIALRCAGFNHVDIVAAFKNNIPVVRVPEYSPHAVAEHAVALILSLNRKIHKAYSRVRENNFSLDGLVGFDLYGRTVGVIGTGRIGSVFSRIMLGFGCRVLGYDLVPKNDLISLGVQYSNLESLLTQADIVSLHIPLNPETYHLINDHTLSLCKENLMLINSSRGALIDTQSLIKALKTKRIGYAGLDVYEEEASVFFKDLSEKILQDDQLARLLTFPNVLLTSHQGFLTEDALKKIALTTLKNINEFESGCVLTNSLAPENTNK